ncbi:hypothetical protein GCM10010358_61990 [Streptomyces minutiscleroticus]|uniref:Uncharacterized protein n=1 Tax=Streptomyces minutiscleroticus TaxID=68238 RepID=A0A918NVJ9_9ACTN|nr:hypothetical protein GCM10010358_61990 [Streptomyces minutiscleroticus]
MPTLADFDAVRAAEGADGGPYTAIVFQHRFGSGSRRVRRMLAERLTWHPYDGALWAEEERRVEVHDVRHATGSWALTWTTAVTNRRDEPLLFGSPTTAGRETAGCTGRFWRGPRAFRDGRITGPDGGGPETMGARAPWLAYTGEHDGADGHATLVFAHAPENDHGGEGGAHPAHWFVRNDPFAAVAPSLVFFDELELVPATPSPAATA